MLRLSLILAFNLFIPYFCIWKSGTESRKQRKITFCTKDKIQPQYTAMFRGALHVFNKMRCNVDRNVRTL